MNKQETTVTLATGDGEPVFTGTVEEFEETLEQVVESLGASLPASGQLAMAMCATCGHSQSPDHLEDGPCQVSWFNADTVQRFCRCTEFWPYRPQREDGLMVLGHEVGFGGSADVLLDRRQPTELWDSLKPGKHVTLTVSLKVASKGFKAVYEKGVLIGLVELRKLKAERVVWSFDELDEETGELL
jgi:hypothetical protein